MTETPTLRDDRPATAGSVDRWRTSTAAAFALVLGVSSLLFVLLLPFTPMAVVLALVALVCGVIGMTQGTRPGVTGRGIAISGVCLAAAALLLSSPALAGAETRFDRSAVVPSLEPPGTR